MNWIKKLLDWLLRREKFLSLPLKKRLLISYLESYNR
jgi:hypothetical protein